jgi:hypothetical protein
MGIPRFFWPQKRHEKFCGIISKAGKIGNAKTGLDQNGNLNRLKAPAPLSKWPAGFWFGAGGRGQLFLHQESPVS